MSVAVAWHPQVDLGSRVTDFCEKIVRGNSPRHRHCPHHWALIFIPCPSPQKSLSVESPPQPQRKCVPCCELRGSVASCLSEFCVVQSSREALDAESTRVAFTGFIDRRFSNELYTFLPDMQNLCPTNKRDKLASENLN